MWAENELEYFEIIKLFSEMVEYLTFINMRQRCNL